MTEPERKRVEQLCRWVGTWVTLLRGNRYICRHCPIPKYRGDGLQKCPAANGKHACSTELIKFFTEVQE